MCLLRSHIRDVHSLVPHGKYVHARTHSSENWKLSGINMVLAVAAAPGLVPGKSSEP